MNGRLALVTLALFSGSGCAAVHRVESARLLEPGEGAMTFALGAEVRDDGRNIEGVPNLFFGGRIGVSDWFELQSQVNGMTRASLGGRVGLLQDLPIEVAVAPAVFIQFADLNSDADSARRTGFLFPVGVELPLVVSANPSGNASITAWSSFEHAFISSLRNEDGNSIVRFGGNFGFAASKSIEIYPSFTAGYVPATGEVVGVGFSVGLMLRGLGSE